MARFEAHLAKRDDDESTPEWIVVEFGPYVDRDGTRIGDVVWKTTDMEFGERIAKDIAYYKNLVYDWETAE